MAIKYCNSTYAINGDGSSRSEAGSPGGAGAFNAIPSTLSSSTDYYCIGTFVVTAQIVTAASTSIVTDPTATQKATIDGSASVSAFSLVRVAAAGFTLQNMILRGADANLAHGIYPASSGASNITIEGCEFYMQSNSSRDCRGVTLTGLDNGPIKISNNYFSGVRYAIDLDVDSTISNKNCIVSGNTFGTIIGSGGFSGDEEKCISTDSSRTDVDWNYQLRIFDNTFTGWGEYAIDLASAKKAMIYDNLFTAPNGRYTASACICGGSNNKGGYAKIFRNRMHVGLESHNGISTRGGNNNEIYNNLIVAHIPINILANTTTSDNTSVYHNTLVSYSNYRAIDATSGTGHTIQNNVLYAATPIRVAAGVTATWTHNDYTGTNTVLGTLTDGGSNTSKSISFDGGYGYQQASAGNFLGVVGMRDAYGFSYRCPPNNGGVSSTREIRIVKV